MIDLASLSPFLLLLFFFFFTKRSICKRSVYPSTPTRIRHRLARLQLSQPLPRNPGQIPFGYSRLFNPWNFHLATTASSFSLDRISPYFSILLNERSTLPLTIHPLRFRIKGTSKSNKERPIYLERFVMNETSNVRS